MISRDGEIGQHSNSTNIPVQQTPKIKIIFVCVNKGVGLDMYTIKEEN